MRKLCTILSAMVIAVLCVALIPTEAQAAEITARGSCGDNLSWVLDDTGTLTISGTGDMYDYGIYYDNGGFQFGDSPWDSASIKSVMMSEGITSIGHAAFSHHANLTEILIPDSVISIGGYAFYSCPSLTSVTVGNGVTSISDNAFELCPILTAITVSSGNRNYSSDAYGVLFNKDKTTLLQAPGAITGSYAIPNSVTSIGAMAFRWCDSLTNVSIPNSVTDIGAAAFSRCSDLTSVIVPDSVTSIGNYAFDCCTSLTDVTIGTSVTSIGVEAFISCESLKSINIPCSVTSIGSGAFCWCDSLSSVTYCGTEDQWNQIIIEGSNGDLTNATRNYHKGGIDTVTKLPTYTAMGEQVSTCVYCDEQLTETIPAKFYGTSVNLGNTLDMYFGFYTGLVDEGGKVVFVREFADGTTETTEAPITSFKKNNSVYDITYTGLAAKEMCDTIHISVYNSEGTLVGEHSDSIRSYILRQLREKEHEQEFRTLCVDLLNYGAAAQEAFGYGDDDLANKDLTDEELVEGTQTTDGYTNQQTIIGDYTCYYGTAYVLETQISMAMAVRADRIGADCYALISYTDHTGTEKSNIRVEGVLNYSVYEFVLNEIVVADGRCLLTIEFYKADGTLVLTVQDSMESYTARNAVDYPLAEKMLAFSDSAYKYLHRADSEIAELNVDLLQSEKYVAYELFEDDELLMEYTISQNPSIVDNVMIFSTGGYYYYAEPGSAGTNPVQYEGKTYYGGDGGFGGYWLVVNGNTLEVYDEYGAWLYADSQSEATYAMQCNGDLRMIEGDADQYPYLWTSQNS